MKIPRNWIAGHRGSLVFYNSGSIELNGVGNRQNQHFNEVSEFSSEWNAYVEVMAGITSYSSLQLATY